MATADELLSLMSTDSDDKTLVIDNYLRKIIIPKGITCLGVEYDDDVMQLDFKMPRYLGDIDLSKFSIRVNYLNAQGEGDVYTVKNPTVTSSSILFTWLVGPTATTYKGDTKFNVCLKLTDADGYIEKEYNTTIATLPVLEGLETDERVVAEYTDILEQWKRELFGIGDTEEASIRNASQKEQENIAQKGAEVLATIPEEYQETAEAAQEGIRTKADAIVCTAEGSIVAVSDSSDDHIRGLRVFGKTTQVTTTGKNLLQVTAVNTTVAGITYTVNPDGTVIASGTSSGVSTLVLNSSFVYEAGVGYTLSGCPSGGGVNTYRLDDVSKIADDGLGGSVVYSENTVAQIRIRIASDVTVNNLLFKPMIRLTAITDDTFEPYSGGVVSPSPNWPQPLTSVTDPFINIRNTNIFGGIALADRIFTASKATTSEKDTVAGTITYTGGGINTAILFENFKPNQQYTFILYGRNTTAPEGYSYTNLVFLYDDCTMGPSNPRFETYGEDSYCIVVSEPGKTVKALIGKWASGTVVVYYDECGLFEGVKTVDDFEQYCDQSANLERTIHGIPVTSGGNYTDANGQQWICDEIDFERGVYIQRVGQMTLTNESNWYYNTDTAGKEFFYTADNSNSNVKAWETRLLCSHFPAIGGAVAMDSDYWTQFSGSGAIRIRHKDLTSLDELAMWLTENHVTYSYVLVTPIETPLTAEELEAFKALKTNYLHTTVLNNAGAHMELSYNADTKTYVDNGIKQTVTDVLEAIENGSY